MPVTDWQEWHEEYGDPESGLSRRRRAVQDRVRSFLDRRQGPLRVVSACAGDGSDLLDVLVARPADAARVTARLVELDPALAGRARTTAETHGLDVEVLVADAGTTDSYVGAVPADLVLWCGVFGNITDHDIRATVDATPTLAAPGASVVWTRGRFSDGDLAPTIAGWFESRGFVRASYHADDEHNHRVVEHQLAAEPRSFEPGLRMFTFVR